MAVDGNDLFAVYEVTRQAVERARAGHGPSMIEAVTYRLGFHNTSDNPSLYRDPREAVEASEHDPVARLSAYAVGAGLVDRNALAAQEAEVRAEVDAALDRALSGPVPGPGEALRHIFAE